MISWKVKVYCPGKIIQSPNSCSRGLAKENSSKANKCNLCDYTSSLASNFRRHVKSDSGKKSFKQCDFASVQASNLRRHLKTHTCENRTNVVDTTMQQIFKRVGGVPNLGFSPKKLGFSFDSFPHSASDMRSHLNHFWSKVVEIPCM